MLRDVLTWLVGHPKVFGQAIWQHLTLSCLALTAAITIALPLSLVLLRWPKAAGATVAAVTVLRAIPSLALLALMLPSLGTYASAEDRGILSRSVVKWAHGD
jgi:osmoprotectant transport system permease protein